MSSVLRALSRVLSLTLVVTMFAMGLGAAATAAPKTRTDKDVASRPGILGVDLTADATGLITGVVYGERGHALDNIVVEAFSAQDPGTTPVASDLTYEVGDASSHGAYALHVPPGSYLVRFSSPDDAGRPLQTTYYGGGAGETVTVAGSDTVALDDVTMYAELTVPVSGTVTDPDGQPLAGVWVSLARVYQSGWGSYRAGTMTDEQGRYTFPHVTPRPAYTVSVDARYDENGEETGLPLMFLGGAPTMGTATTFAVPSGSAGATVPEIRVSRGVPIDVSVVGPGNRVPGSASFALYAKGPAGRLEYISSAWVEGGHAVLAVLPGYEYTASAYPADDWNADGDMFYFGDTLDEAQADFVTVTEASSMAIHGFANTNARLTVRVTDAAGSMVTRDVAVNLVRRDAGGDLEYVNYFNARPDGLFSRRVAPGDYIVEVHDWKAGTTTYLGDTANAAEARTVTVETEPQDLGTIHLPITLPAFTGRVLDEVGDPVVGVPVTVYGLRKMNPRRYYWIGQVATDEQGGYGVTATRRDLRRYVGFVAQADGWGLGYGVGFAGGGESLPSAHRYAAVGGLDPIVLPRYSGLVRGKVSYPGIDFWTSTDLTLYRWVDNAWSQTGYTYTSGNNFAFRDVEPGVYAISARGRSWMSGRTYASDAEIAGLPANDTAPGAFSVTGDPAVAPDVTMSPLATVAVSTSGFEVGRQVEVYRWSGAGDGATLTRFMSFDDWWSDSAIEVPLAPGQYAIRVTSRGDDETRRAWYGGHRPSTVDDAATLVVGTDDQDITIDLGEPDVVTGKVVDAAGNAVADAEVELRAAQVDCMFCGEWVLDSTTTDDQGHYAFTDWSDRDAVSVTARATDQGLGEASSDVYPVDDASVEVADLALPAQSDVLRGLITTADGRPLEGSTSVELWHWDADLQRFAFVDQRYVNGRHYAFNGIQPGTYAVLATNWPYGEQRYVPTWIGGTDAPLASDSAGVVTFGDTDDLVQAPPLELSRGVEVSGTVATATGAPLADVAVSGWETHTAGPDDGVHVTRSREVYAVTDSDGHYAMRVTPDSQVEFSASREGLESHPLTGTDLLDVRTEDLTHDVEMTPSWGSVGAVAGQREDYCLSQTADNTTTFHGVPLDIDRAGLISVEGTWGSVLDDSAVALAPLSELWFDQRSWGVSADGSTLCAQWVRHGYSRVSGDFVGADSATDVVQAFITADGTGGFDATFRYDTVSSPSGPAGVSDGLRRHSTSTDRLIPGWEDGSYRDDGANALVTGHTEGDAPGTYRFDADFLTQDDALDGGWTWITGRRGVGETLTANTGPWTIDDVETEDVDVIYTWLRGKTVVGTGPTYVVPVDDYGRWLRLEVEGYAAGHRVVVHTTGARIRQGSPAVTGLAPSITPASPAYGEQLAVDTGDWTPGDGLTDADVTLAYQWRRNGHAITDATGTTYQPVGADAGQDLTVRVTATATDHGTVTATSPIVVAPRMPLLTATTEPSITGTPQVGQPLTVDPGVWSAEPDLAYQWFVDGRSKGSGTTFTPDSSDRGGYVTVVVRASAPGHRDGQSSASVGPVIPADAEVSPLSIHVRDADDQSPLANASVTACDEVTWSCVWGNTDANGDFSGSAIAGSRYAIYVYPADSEHRSAERHVTTQGRGVTTQVTVDVTKPTPPPVNVSIPTSTWTMDGEPVVFWQQDQDFRVTGCAGVTLPTYTVTFSDGTPSRTAALTQGTPDGDGLATYSAMIPAFYPSHGETVISTNVPADCEAGTEPTSVTVYIDPSGTVTDQYGRPISGATVTLSRSTTAGGPFAPVPDGSDIMSPDNRANPSITGADGGFRWDVTEGWYRVKAAAPGCTTVTSDAMQVPPVRVDLLLKLTCTSAAPTGTVAVTGTPAVGSTLSTTTTSWGDPFGVGVQWLRDGQPILDATGLTYQVTATDAGHTLSVRQTAQRPQFVQEGGRGAPVDFIAVSATSPTVSVPASNTGGGGGGGTGGGGGGGDTSAPTMATVPALVGSGKVDTVLTAPQPTWSLNGVTTTTQWLVDGVEVPGGTTSSYTVQAVDLGHQVSVRWTGALTGHTSGEATSQGVTAILGDAPVAASRPTVVGTAAAGQTLTATSGDWDQPGLAFGYQWLRDGEPIAGADQASYDVLVADAHRTLAVVVTATRAGHADGEATSPSVLVSRLATTVTARLEKSRITKGDVAHLRGKVAVDGLTSPFGTVTVLDGKRVVKKVTLGSAKAGALRLGLRHLAVGVHQLRLRYVATDDSARGSSEPVRLVVKSKRHHDRGAVFAAARAWVG